MKTKENNRLIAEFMEYPGDGKGLYFFHLKGNDVLVSADNLKYHTSWDWLIPVVEKIELLGYSVEKNFQRVDKDWQCLITKGNDILFQEFAYDSIEAMYQVVVSFIEFYNKP